MVEELTADEAAALIWVIDGLPCMWTGKGECPHCSTRRRDYETARAKLEQKLSNQKSREVKSKMDNLNLGQIITVVPIAYGAFQPFDAVIVELGKTQAIVKDNSGELALVDRVLLAPSPNESAGIMANQKLASDEGGQEGKNA